MLAVVAQVDYATERDEAIDLHVGGTTPPKPRCNNRAIQEQLDGPVELVVAIDLHVGCTNPRAKCQLANSGPARSYRAIDADVTEEPDEVLGDPVGNVAALKLQDCG